ncbi:hypothetical protein M0R45_004668 [Rubus argutus]|uniref:Uncharacterized protein n=1 Tax=Rubus argutus TaxID=59490 RepID=A0AAW1YKE7_RUBAR
MAEYRDGRMGLTSLKRLAQGVIGKMNWYKNGYDDYDFTDSPLLNYYLPGSVHQNSKQPWLWLVVVEALFLQKVTLYSNWEPCWCAGTPRVVARSNTYINLKTHFCCSGSAPQHAQLMLEPMKSFTYVKPMQYSIVYLSCDAKTKEHATKRKELHGKTSIRAMSGTWGEKLDGALFYVYKFDFSCDIVTELYSGFILLIESELADDVGNIELELYLVSKRVNV